MPKYGNESPPIKSGYRPMSDDAIRAATERKEQNMAGNFRMDAVELLNQVC